MKSTLEIEKKEENVEDSPASELLVDSISQDGGLYNLGWYLSWNIGSPQAAIDGKFTSAELRAIADYMEANTEAYDPAASQSSA